MNEEESQQGYRGLRSYRRLQFSLFEQVLVGAMLLVLLVAGVEALDGQHVGKSDALAIAKLQGQQELMALKLK
jgi:hypothetical protein